MRPNQTMQMELYLTTLTTELNMGWYISPKLMKILKKDLESEYHHTPLSLTHIDNNKMFAINHLNDDKVLHNKSNQYRLL
jgi:hypothetical protein